MIWLYLVQMACIAAGLVLVRKIRREHYEYLEEIRNLIDVGQDEFLRMRIAALNGGPYRRPARIEGGEEPAPSELPPTGRVVCQDCRYKGIGFDKGAPMAICLARPDNGLFPVLGQESTNKRHDCGLFQKK